MKTWFQKILNQLRDPALIYQKISQHRFPTKPTSAFQIKARLRGLEAELKTWDLSHNLGSLYTPPHPQATQAYKQFIDYNPGNLGDWSDDVTRTYATTAFEYDVVHSLIDLYRGSHKKWGGSITSGGTEGNIFSAWLGRSYLEKQGKTKAICLLKTSLTHYSVRKAGQVGDIPQFFTPLGKNWGMDPDGFAATVTALYKQGYRGFMVPLTLGYTATGSCDDITLVTQKAERLKKSLKGIGFFFWVDAAFNGLIAPFLQSTFAPLANPAIQAFIVDFHKFGQVPYPAGIVLCRSDLKKNLIQDIDYLSEKDATLLGSRSGIPAVSIWSMIHSLGKTGYRKMVEEQIKNKEYFIKKIQSKFPKTEIITGSHSLSCGLIFYGLPHNRLPLAVEEKYGLFPGKTKLLFYQQKPKTEIIYKCFFLPHLKQKVLDECLQDLAMQL